MPMRTVIVEDDHLSAEYLRLVCENFGAEVVATVADGETATNVILEERPDWVLMDVRLKGNKDGIIVAHDVYRELPQAKIIYITAHSDPVTFSRIVSDHPHRVLIKPTSPDQLREAFGLR